MFLIIKNCAVIMIGKPESTPRYFRHAPVRVKLSTKTGYAIYSSNPEIHERLLEGKKPSITCKVPPALYINVKDQLMIYCTGVLGETNIPIGFNDTFIAAEDQTTEFRSAVLALIEITEPEELLTELRDKFECFPNNEKFTYINLLGYMKPSVEENKNDRTE